jgi:hypothetical protein
LGGRPAAQIEILSILCILVKTGWEEQKAMRYLVVIAFAFLLAVGCSGKEPKTVSWYLEHEAEMKQKCRECNDDLTRLGKDPDCINALEAESRLKNKRYFNTTVPLQKSYDSPGIMQFK